MCKTYRFAEILRLFIPFSWFFFFVLFFSFIIQVSPTNGTTIFCMERTYSNTYSRQWTNGKVWKATCGSILYFYAIKISNKAFEYVCKIWISYKTTEKSNNKKTIESKSTDKCKTKEKKERARKKRSVREKDIMIEVKVKSVIQQLVNEFSSLHFSIDQTLLFDSETEGWNLRKNFTWISYKNVKKCLKKDCRVICNAHTSSYRLSSGIIYKTYCITAYPYAVTSPIYTIYI